MKNLKPSRGRDFAGTKWPLPATIRHSCPNRLPLVDALIAGCATAAGLTLVHRDSHLDAIPTAVLAVLRLPDKLRPHRRT